MTKMADDALTRKDTMKLFRADVYRDHVMTELLVQAVDVDDARAEIKRAWQGWDIRGVVYALPMTRTWKIGAWTAVRKSLESVREEALAVLERIEFGVWKRSDTREGHCCGVCSRFNREGHAPNCWLGKELAAIRALQSTARVAEGDSDMHCQHERGKQLRLADRGRGKHRALPPGGRAECWCCGKFVQEIVLFRSFNICKDCWNESEPTPESPAKEQPGEQNAAPAGGGSQPVDTSAERDKDHVSPAQQGQPGHEPSESPILAVPQVAAPDVAAIVREWARKEARQIAHFWGAPHFDLDDYLEKHVAALIEKLGQGRIPPKGWIFVERSALKVAITMLEYAEDDPDDHAQASALSTYFDQLLRGVVVPPPPERP